MTGRCSRRSSPTTAAASSPTSRSTARSARHSTTEWAAIPDPLAARGLDTGPAQQGHPVAQARGLVVGRQRCLRRRSYARRDDGSVDEHDGQVWRLDPGANTMELIASSASTPTRRATPSTPPTTSPSSPWGGLILCADGEGVQHLFTVNTDGESTHLRPQRPRRRRIHRRDVLGGRQTLFVNLQEPGMTFAITGPWDTSSAAPRTSTP